MNRHERRKHKVPQVVELASRVLAQVSSDPEWVIRNYTNPKPKWCPVFLWAMLIKLVIHFPGKRVK